MPNKSSRRWLKEHFSDPYVKQAQKSGYRSRAAYKLLEINARDRLFKPGMTIIDLGAAPGGWSQVVAELVKPNGKVIASDMLPMEDIAGVVFIQADFSTSEGLTTLLAKLSSIEAKSANSVDWVLSDMAPNVSGNASVDVPRSMYLAELALDFSLKVLGKEGGLLIKVFEGEGFDALLALIKGSFKTVAIRKPKASRGRSREIYILARGLKAK